MIITRTGETVEFQLTETNRISIDAGQLASALHVVERSGGGRLIHAMVLTLVSSQSPIRYEASAAQIAAMHVRLAEVMADTTGPILNPEIAQSIPARLGG